MLALAVAFALVFSAELYLFAATTSIPESYQPGISAALRPFNPLLLVLGLAGAPLLGALASRRHRVRLASFAQTISFVALAACVLALVAIFSAEAMGLQCRRNPPAVRELATTIEHSLTCPRFSNRSGAGAFYGGILSGVLAWGARRTLREK